MPQYLTRKDLDSVGRICLTVIRDEDVVLLRENDQFYMITTEVDLFETSESD